MAGYKRTPFTLKSGNSPLTRKGGNIFKGKKINIGKGLSKFFGGVEKAAKKVESDISEVVKTDVPKQFTGDVKKTVEKISKTVNPSTKGKKRTKKGKVGTPGRGGNIFK